MANPQILLIQIRDPDDDMRFHEIKCFARVAGTTKDLQSKFTIC